MSAAGTVSDGDDDKKNSQLPTGTRGRADSHHRMGVRCATTMQAPRRHQRPALDRGDPGTRRTSWQRVRPLPIPRLPSLPPRPTLDGSPPAAVSPPDAEVPLLSPLSLRLSAAERSAVGGDPPPSVHEATSQRRLPIGERSADVGQRRLRTTSGGSSSPYYFKLDPALTARQNDRHLRHYSHNPCFMCESEIR